MKICVISGSSRAESQSRRVSDALIKMLEDFSVETSLVDLFEQNITTNLNDVWGNVNGQGDVVASISAVAEAADGFIVVTPEWGGMATPAVKAMFTVVTGFAHKPGLIVSVSASKNGAYPVAELRMSSHKNSKIVYIPDHLIVRDVATAFTDKGDEYNTYITERAKFSINALLEYAKALKPVRENPDLYKEEYANGM